MASYCVVDVESTGKQIPIAFLERTKYDFTKKYSGGKAATAVANILKREFGPKLKEQMQYCVDHPEEVIKLAKVKAQVSEVKGVMMENIEKDMVVFSCCEYDGGEDELLQWIYQQKQIAHNTFLQKISLFHFITVICCTREVIWIIVTFLVLF